MKNEYKIPASILSPLIAALSGAAFNVGICGFVPEPLNATEKTKRSFKIRFGISGSLFCLGMYSGARVFHQDNELGIVRCFATAGICLGMASATKLPVVETSKGYTLGKPHPWRYVVKSGIAGALVALGSYGYLGICVRIGESSVAAIEGFLVEYIAKFLHGWTFTVKSTHRYTSE